MLTLGSNESRFFLRRSSTVFLVSGVILRASNVWISSLTPRLARKLRSSVQTTSDQLSVTSFITTHSAAASDTDKYLITSVRKQKPQYFGHKVNLALHPSRVAKSSTSFGWGKGGKVTSAVWQVTLCDLIWHVISRSGVVTSITNCYIRFTFTLLTLLPPQPGFASY